MCFQILLHHKHNLPVSHCLVEGALVFCQKMPMHLAHLFIYNVQSPLHKIFQRKCMFSQCGASTSTFNYLMKSEDIILFHYWLLKVSYLILTYLMAHTCSEKKLSPLVCLPTWHYLNSD